jgi:hypothetical protein
MLLKEIKQIREKEIEQIRDNQAKWIDVIRKSDSSILKLE